MRQAIDDLVKIAVFDLEDLDFPADGFRLFRREFHHCSRECLSVFP